MNTIQALHRDLARALGDEEAVFGLTPMAKSFHGSTFRASTAVGEMVVKVRDDRRSLAVTRSVTQLLRNRGCVVQEVAVPLRRTTSGWLLGLRWLDGHVLGTASLAGLSGERRQRLGEAMAAWLATLHAIGTRHGDWLSRAEARYRQKKEQAIALGALSDAHAAVMEDCWRGLRASLANVRESLIHRDLHTANVLLLGDGSPCPIDFENSRFADPLCDLVKVRDFILPLDAYLAGGFTAAYGMDRWTANEQRRFRAACLLEYLSAIVYHARRREDATVRQRLWLLLATCESE